MIHHLELIKESDYQRTYKVPNVIIFLEKEYKMSSPSNLFGALNKANKSFDSLAVELWGENNSNLLNVHIPYKFYRKTIWAPKFFSRRDYLEWQKKNNVEKRLIRHCVICNEQYEKGKTALRGTCGNQTCIDAFLSLRGQSISKTHWCYSENYSSIRDKRINTRLQNDVILNRVYVPWNKGKTGVYSQDTIEKIKTSTRKQFESEKIIKTSIEKKIEMLLLTLGIKYKYSYFVGGRQYDFCVLNKFLIEVQGDFWHANPKYWGDVEGKKPLREHQKMKVLDDIIKVRIAKENGYNLLCVWENDINNDWNNVETSIKTFIGVINE
jgi:G:T-mismatch repair DNA endonuclease (very short patch repair protein)